MSSGSHARGNEPRPIASMLHTFGLILIIAIFALLVRHYIGNHSAAALEQFGRIRIYLVALSSEWLLFLYVRIGLRTEDTTVRGLIDRASWTPARWCHYAGIAVSMALVWMGCGDVLGKLLPIPPEVVRHLLVLMPRTPLERTVWIVLSVSAGFCEEFIYRGYLLQQFRIATDHWAGGITIQAIIYGIAHAALPWEVAVSVTFLGVFFEVFAAWRRSLVPGMLMHASIDILPGILFRA